MFELVSAFLGILVAQVAPGPNSAAVAAVSLGAPRRTGIAMAAGIAAGVMAWATLFALGAGAVIDRYPLLMNLLRLVGGGYLLWLAWATIATPGLDPSGETEALEPWAAFRRGLVIVLTNPKAALIWVGAALYLAPVGLGTLGFLVFGAVVAASALAVYGGLAVLFATGRAEHFYLRHARRIEWTLAAVFALVGGKLIFDALTALLA